MRRRVLRLGPSLAWVRLGVVFPSADGRRAAILAGISKAGESVVGRVNAAGKLVWRVLLGHEIGGLVRLDTGLLDPSAKEPWFVFTTKSGTQFVIDSGGVLRAEAKLPNPKNEEERAIRALRAGQLDEKRMGIVVRVRRGIWLYPLSRR